MSAERSYRRIDDEGNTIPIHDTPSHPFYGPVRRLHVMLLQLTAHVRYEGVMTVYEGRCIAPWDVHLAFLLDKLGYSEAQAQGRVLADLLDCIRIVEL